MKVKTVPKLHEHNFVNETFKTWFPSFIIKLGIVNQKYDLDL